MDHTALYVPPVLSIIGSAPLHSVDLNMSIPSLKTSVETYSDSFRRHVAPSQTLDDLAISTCMYSPLMRDGKAYSPIETRFSTLQAGWMFT